MKAKITRASKNFFGLCFCVLLGLVLLMLRGQNGGDILQITVLEQQLSLASPLNLKNILSPGQEFEITFQNYGENIAGGNIKDSYWKLIEGNGCTLVEKYANNGSVSTRYKCTYPNAATMTIKMQKVDKNGQRLIGDPKVFTIP